MATVPAATCCPISDVGFADCCAAVFCQPCVYGSGLTKFRRDQKGGGGPEGLFPDTSGECCVIVGTCVLGSVMLCLTGVYIRAHNEALCPAVLAECCPLCSCAPCQMNQYRNTGSLSTTSQMLS